MFLGEDLPLWLLLAFGAALAVGNAMALIRPQAPSGTESGREPARVPPPPRPESDGLDRANDPAPPPAPAPPALLPASSARPPVWRSMIMIVIGSVAAIWALASLISG